MSKIHFFDASPQDQKQINSLVGGLPYKDQIIFHDGPVTPEPEAEIISLFVSSRVTAELIAAMPHLKLIACRSTGYDNIDLAAASQHGVTVCNVPSYGQNTVAEYAFGLLLSLSRKIPQSIQQLKAGDTSHQALQGFDLMDKTLGIIGAGHIGCNMAAVGRGFGMRVMAFDARPNPELAKEYSFTYESLDHILGAADVISLHVPNLPETKHLINTETLAKMKPTAVLINTSRGEVVDTQALISALSQSHLAGAALDVFEGETLGSLDEELHQLRAKHTDQLVLEEALEISALQKMPNVILTNHNAYNTAEAVGRINQATLDNITAFLAGTPQNQIKTP